MRWWAHPGRLRFQRKAKEEGLSGKGQGRAAREVGESGGNSDFESTRRGFCEESQVVGISCTSSSLLSSSLKACSFHLSTLSSKSIWYLGASWWPQGVDRAEEVEEVGNGAVWLFFLSDSSCLYWCLISDAATPTSYLCWAAALENSFTAWFTRTWKMVLYRTDSRVR